MASAPPVETRVLPQTYTFMYTKTLPCTPCFGHFILRRGEKGPGTCTLKPCTEYQGSRTGREKDCTRKLPCTQKKNCAHTMSCTQNLYSPSAFLPFHRRCRWSACRTRACRSLLARSLRCCSPAPLWQLRIARRSACFVIRNRGQETHANSKVCHARLNKNVWDLVTGKRSITARTGVGMKARSSGSVPNTSWNSHFSLDPIDVENSLSTAGLLSCTCEPSIFKIFSPILTCRFAIEIQVTWPR